jgi:hypothetical protein
LYWQLTAIGVHCDVIAPSLTPANAGDRVKTGRKDAGRLARRAPAISRPCGCRTRATDRLRDLMRTGVMKQDQLRAHRRRPPRAEGMPACR